MGSGRQRRTWYKKHLRRQRWQAAKPWLLGTLIGLVVILVGAYAFAPRTPAPVADDSPRPVRSAEAKKHVPVVAFIGDSYTAGAGTTKLSRSWVERLARSQGWEAHNFGRGGTGYANGVAGGTAQIACGLDYCPSYIEMIPEAADVSPDIVIVAGGRNEATQPGATQSANIDAFFQELAAQLPDAQVIAVNPLWDDDETPEAVADMSGMVERSVESTGGRFLDIGQPLLGEPGFVAEDGAHPNDDGHKAIAEATSAALP